MNHVRITRNGQVTIPKSIRSEMKLDEGSLVRFEVSGTRVVLIPEVAVPRDQALRQNAR